MANIEDGNQELKDSLRQELIKAEAASESSVRAMGAPAPRERFDVQGVKIMKKAVLEKELADYDLAAKTAIEGLVSRASNLDEVEKAKFRNDLQNRFNSVRLAVLRDAGRAQKQLAKQQLSDQKKMQLMQAISGGTSTLAMGLISGGPKKTADVSSAGVPSPAGDYSAGTAMDVGGLTGTSMGTTNAEAYGIGDTSIGKIG